MSFYQNLAKVGPKLIGQARLFKWAFNLFPMYRRSTAKLTHVSKDLLHINAKLPISYKNKNYAGSIFGGSMFSTVDPIPMVQLINILDNQYIVWDKSAAIFFKIPARENLYAEFVYSQAEIEHIKQEANAKGELEIIKKTLLTNANKSKVYCEVHKTIYIATKAHFKEKQKAKKHRPNK